MAAAKLWTKLGAGILFSVLIGIALVAASRADLLPAAPGQITYDRRALTPLKRALGVGAKTFQRSAATIRHDTA